MGSNRLESVTNDTGPRAITTATGVKRPLHGTL